MKRLLKILFKIKSSIIRIEENDVLCIIKKENKNITMEDVEYFCMHLSTLIRIPVVFFNECDFKVIRKPEAINKMIDKEKYIEELR